MDLVLYKMSASGRINLTGLVSNRETYFSAAKNEDGSVTLTPVRIVSARDGAEAEAEKAEDPQPAEAPWTP